MIIRFIFLISVLVVPFLSKSTHIKGGEIKVERISSSTLTYRITVIGYSDLGSTVGFGGGTINMGDGNSFDIIDLVETDPTFTVIDDELGFNSWEFEYTYSGSGSYVIGYSEQNRNSGVVNMDNSIDTPFYTESTFVIDPSIGENSPPYFLIQPNFDANTYTRYLSSHLAYDADGDSLSYELEAPKSRYDRQVDNYRFPNALPFYPNFSAGNQDQNGPPAFVISDDGTLSWDAPGMMGEYAVVVTVSEWREISGEWELLSSVSRDFSIIVEDSGLPGPEPLGVQEELTDGIKIYPNPFVTEFNFEPESRDKTYWLFDLTGKKWGQIQPGINDFSHLPKGIYIVKWNKRQAIRIVKN